MAVNFKKASLTAIAIAISGACGSLPAWAEATDAASAPPPPAQDNTGHVEEIVVTAQRRSEGLQKVPIAVTVATADSLAAKGITSLVNISAAAPGVEFSTAGTAATIYLRGVGASTADPNGEPSVALYIDGVYIAAPFASLSSLNNIERIEILKGPQGTLFGRNATGGVIQIITRDPKHDPSADIQVGYANYNTLSGQFYGTTGISQTAAIDLAVNVHNQLDGFGRNVTLNKDTNRSSSLAIRSKLLWEPTARTSVRLAADYDRDYSTRLDYVLPKGVLNLDGIPSPANSFDTIGSHINYSKGHQEGVSMRIDQDVDFAGLVSITSYRNAKGIYSAHADAATPDFITVDLPQTQSNVSQEFQLISPKASSFDWVVGTFLYHSKAAYNGSLSGPALGGGAIAYDTAQITNSESVYAQATDEILPKLKLTGGLRFTHERQKVEGTEESALLFPPGYVVPTAKPTGFNKLTWRAAINYELADQVSAYVSYNRGIKSGGFNLLGISDAAYLPEQLDAYEAGLKSELFDRKLRLNLSAFLYDYKNIQFQVITFGAAHIANAAAARIKGVDADFEAVPFRNLTLSGGATFIPYSKYTDFPNAPAYTASPLTGPPIGVNGSGSRTIYSPKFTGTISADYVIPVDSGKIHLGSSLYRNSGSFFQAAAYTDGERFANPAHNLLSASIAWNSNDNRYSVRIWGANLTNSLYYIEGSPSGNGYLSSRGDPRTYGITLGAKL